MTQQIYQVGAFTNRPFAGNLAAICVLDGPATLASTQILWSEGHVPATQTIRFFSRSGLMTAVCRDDWIELDFPEKNAGYARVKCTSPPVFLPTRLLYSTHLLLSLHWRPDKPGQLDDP